LHILKLLKNGADILKTAFRFNEGN